MVMRHCDAVGCRAAVGLAGSTDFGWLGGDADG